MATTNAGTTVGIFRWSPNRRRCARCISTTGLHRFDGEWLCSRHLEQAVDHVDTHRDPEPPDHSHERDLYCIGLDT